MGGPVMAETSRDHETRVSLLEYVIQNINENLSELKESMDRVNEKLERMVRIEERQRNTDEAFGRAFTQIDAHEKRVAAIETQLPELNTIKSWVIRGVLAVVATVGLGTVAAVFSIAAAARMAVSP